MPATYWVPFESVSLPIKTEHLHAVVTSWFDARTDAAAAVHPQPPNRWAQEPAAGVPHQAKDKPYAASPATEQDGLVGVQVSVLTEEAEGALHRSARPGTPVRFGSMTGRLGEPVCLDTAEWSELVRPRPARAWVITFETPTCFRSGERTSVLPIPALLLRTPAVLWTRWSPVALDPLTGDDHRAMFVTHASLETVDYRLADQRPERSRRQEPYDVPGVVGALRLEAEAATASRLEPLLRFAEFSGMGGFTRKGMGVVSVVPEE